MSMLVRCFARDRSGAILVRYGVLVAIAALVIMLARAGETSSWADSLGLRWLQRGIVDVALRPVAVEGLEDGRIQRGAGAEALG